MARAKKSDDLQSIFAPPVAAPAVPEPTAAATSPTLRKTGSRPTTREGKRGKLVYLTEAAEKQLTHIGTEHDKTQQALMVEAVNLLFERYGRDQIA